MQCQNNAVFKTTKSVIKVTIVGNSVQCALHQTVIETRKLCYRKDDRAMRAIYVDREPLRRYGHSKL